jgi:hypothetical protein
MHSEVKRRAASVDALRRPEGSVPRLLGAYTLLFALFFAVVFSPFWLYGRAFLMTTDGNAQHLSSLTYFKFWLKSIVNSLLAGRLEVPFWSM